MTPEQGGLQLPPLFSKVYLKIYHQSLTIYLKVVLTAKELYITISHLNMAMKNPRHKRLKWRRSFKQAMQFRKMSGRAIPPVMKGVPSPSHPIPNYALRPCSLVSNKTICSLVSVDSVISRCLVAWQISTTFLITAEMIFSGDDVCIDPSKQHIRVRTAVTWPDPDEPTEWQD